MSDSLNNKELVAVGHHLAKVLSSDTAIIDIAKILSRLAECLDCITAALREMTKQRNALGIENAALKAAFNPKEIPEDAIEAFTETAIMDHDWDDTGEWSWVENDTDVIRAVLDALKPETPATDAFLAEVRAQGVERFINFCGEENSVYVDSKAYYRSLSDAVAEFAAQLRQDANTAELVAAGIITKMGE